MGFVTLAHKVAGAALYTRLEYLESSGTQYIDTGYYPTPNTHVIADVYILSQEITKIYGTVSAQSGYTNSFDFALRSDTKWQMIYGNNFDYVAGGGVGRALIDHDKNVCSITNDATHTMSISGPKFDAVSSYSMYLFGRNLANEASLSAIRVYSFQIFDGEVLVRDLVPVKMGDGTLGMYDKANRVFYPNSGSGTFIAGAEVV